MDLIFRMLHTVNIYYTAIHKSPRKRGDLCMENKKWGLNPSDDSLLMSEQATAKRMNVTNGTQEFLFIS